MIDLPTRVARHCRRHGLLPPGAPVLAMVSGGADSLCMLHVLCAVHDGPVGVLTIDHGLRPEAAAEADHVARVAAGLGCPVYRESLDLRPGAAVQARARTARLDCAERVAAEGGYARIALGHTATDQAETVLFRLARGSGRGGARGMAARRDAFVRPLLCVTREDTHDWCTRHGVAVVDDPSNHDDAFRRVRVRHELLPALERIHPAAARHLAEFAELLGDEEEVLMPVVDAAWGRCARGDGLDAAALGAEPAPMRRLLVRRLLAEVGLPSGARERAHVERVAALAGTGGRVSLPGGGGAAVEGGCVVAFGPPGPDPAAALLEVPGRARFGEVDVVAAPGRAAAPDARSVAVAVDGPLEVRSTRPGDRLSLAGGGRRAVGRLLADAGVAARRRGRVPVVAQGSRVVWVVGHRAAADLLVAPGGRATVLSAVAAA